MVFTMSSGAYDGAAVITGYATNGIGTALYTID
jgi:hypothetical protein